MTGLSVNVLEHGSMENLRRERGIPKRLWRMTARGENNILLYRCSTDGDYLPKSEFYVDPKGRIESRCRACERKRKYGK
jgi:hypothetical protein